MSETSTVRLGIVGCGVIGRNHLDKASRIPGLDVVAVADIVPERAREAADRFGIEGVYRDGLSLIEESDAQAVVLAMPAGCRAGLARRAFGRGLHVLLEKPAAMNAAELREIIRARGDLVAGCLSSRLSLLPGARAAAEFVAAGHLGPIRLVHCRAISGPGTRSQREAPPWRLSRSLNGGGILVNWGVYDLDFLFSVTGWSLAPRRVFARAWPVPPVFGSRVAPGSDAETHALALIECDGGAALSIERGEFVAAASRAAWQVIGEAGSLSLVMPISDGPKRVIFEKADREKGIQAEVIWEGVESWDTDTLAPLADFAAAVREDRRPATCLEKALVIQRVTDAIYRSAETGTLVTI